MTDPLLKTPRDPLSPEEEAELTRRLSEAYLEAEASSAEPVFKRIQHKISVLLERLGDSSREG